MKLFPYQEKGVDHLVSMLKKKKRYGLFDAMGLGKTVQAIKVAERLNCTNILVVTRASVTVSWGREWERWGTEEPVIVSYNFIQKMNNLETLQKKWDIVICDECQVLKNPYSKTTKNFFSLLKFAKYYLPLSGTPAPRSAADYWTLFTSLKGPEFGTYEEFEEKFCFSREVFARKYFYGFRRHAELERTLKSVGLRRLFSEVEHELPDIMYSDLEIEIDKKELNRQLGVVEISDEDLEAETPKPAIGRVLKEIAKLKVRALEEWLEDRDEQMLIFYHHTEVLKELEAFFYDRDKLYSVIRGGQSSADKQRAIDNFQKGYVQTLICQLQAGGVGLNITAARTILFLERPWNPSDYSQAVSRVRRIGQAGKVHVYNSIAIGTLDERVSRVLYEKAKSIERIEG